MTTVAVRRPADGAPVATPADSDRPLAAAVSGLLTASAGVVGVGVGAAGLAGATGPARLDWLIPLIGVQLELTPLGGLFLALTGAVAIPVGIYTIGYGRRGRMSRFPLAVLPVFVAAMMAVPAAGSVSTFLLAWELMALCSLVLVLADHHSPQVRSAGVYYAVLTHLAFAAILLALMLLTTTGTGSFAEIGRLAADLPTGTRTAVFLLTLLGFGSKAGLLPLHGWLARAHPEAPSPVSALMSAAMVTMGIYGMVRVWIDLLGAGPQWWGLLVVVIGALSAVFGALQAAVATDLKRLLAYSTVENMGLVTIALGAAMLLAASTRPALAGIAITAALLHLVAHAAFKSLAFLAAGSVLAATGLRDLDRLGGLARRMPSTTALFGIAALGASGLPLGAGFVSEWLLLQSLIHAPRQAEPLLTLAMPLTVGAIALTVGLGVVAMVKAFGVGFLARARSAPAEQAVEAPGAMRMGMVLAGAGCVVLALAPAVIWPAIARASGGLAIGAAPIGGVLVRLPDVAGSIAPAIISGALIAAVLVSIGLSRWGSRRRPARADSPLWACGASRLTPRMQYTATSFAQPMQRVFGGVLRPQVDWEVSHPDGSVHLIDRISYRTRPSDAVEERLYAPVVRAVLAAAKMVRRAHTGSVHLYLAYGGAGLLIVLAVGR